MLTIYLSGLLVEVPSLLEVVQMIMNSILLDLLFGPLPLATMSILNSVDCSSKLNTSVTAVPREPDEYGSSLSVSV